MVLPIPSTLGAQRGPFAGQGHPPKAGGWDPPQALPDRSPGTLCPGSPPWAPAGSRTLCARGANSKAGKAPEPRARGLVGVHGQAMAPPWHECRELLREPHRGPAHWALGGRFPGGGVWRRPPQPRCGHTPRLRDQEQRGRGKGKPAQSRLLPTHLPSKPLPHPSSPDFPGEREEPRWAGQPRPGAGT